MILEAPGIVLCHALGNVTTEVELRSIEVPHGHLPADVTAGDVGNSLQLRILHEELAELRDPVKGTFHVAPEAASLRVCVPNSLLRLPQTFRA